MMNKADLDRLLPLFKTICENEKTIPYGDLFELLTKIDKELDNITIERMIKDADLNIETISSSSRKLIVNMSYKYRNLKTYEFTR